VEVARWQSVVSDLPTRLASVPSDAQRLYSWTAEDS
jgi:hypothetical protein